MSLWGTRHRRASALTQVETAVATFLDPVTLPAIYALNHFTQEIPQGCKPG